MKRLFNQGMILGEDNEKMSKSRGNVVNPDDFVATMGADTVRAYLMFIGPWSEGGPWNSQGIEGIFRFLSRIWDVAANPAPRPTEPPTAEAIAELWRITHKTIRRVTDDMDNFRFNTLLAGLMEFNNYLVRAKNSAVYGSEAWTEAVRSLVLMIAPLCPHIGEELWERIGGKYSVHTQKWPEWSAELAADPLVTLIVQINGKVRDRITVPAGTGAEELQKLALASEGAKRHTEGKQVVKVIVAEGKLVNIVVR
jgi:leucyl-tRNA synthetase